MRGRRLGVLALAAAVTLASSEAFAFEVSFSWCGSSPQFALSDVPKGTVKLDFQMHDLNAPSYPHGGGSIAYRGEAVVPCGALTGSYRRPSPPPGEVHRYRWTVKAFDAAGKLIGTATSLRKFPE